MTELINLSVDEEVAIADRIVRNKLRIKELTEENDILLARYKNDEVGYPAGTYKEHGQFYVKVTTNQRVDDALAKAKLNTNEYKRLSKTVIDPTLAKRVLTAERYNLIVKRYDNKIEVGLHD